MSEYFTESRSLEHKMALKSLKPLLGTIKKNLDGKINYKHYIHVCTIFVFPNDKD